MYTYDDLTELPRICAKNAHIASSKEMELSYINSNHKYSPILNLHLAATGGGESRRRCIPSGADGVNRWHTRNCES